MYTDCFLIDRVDHFGENPMTPQEKDKVYEQRKKAVAAYEVHSI